MEKLYGKQLEIMAYKARLLGLDAVHTAASGHIGGSLSAVDAITTLYFNIMNIDPQLYEAAAMDGAGRFKRILHVTLPGMLPIIMLMLTLSLGSVLSAGFDQTFNLYSPVVYRTGDIIDTWVYRSGLLGYQYSLATAVGLLKSVVSTILIVISYKLADKFAGYRLF